MQSKCSTSKVCIASAVQAKYAEQMQSKVCRASAVQSMQSKCCTKYAKQVLYKACRASAIQRMQSKCCTKYTEQVLYKVCRASAVQSMQSKCCTKYAEQVQYKLCRTSTVHANYACLQIEMAVQGGRKRSEANRIGQEPQTNRQQLVEDCYKELVTLAKTIGQSHCWAYVY